jgi:hypothetical protein
MLRKQGIPKVFDYSLNENSEYGVRAAALMVELGLSIVPV